MILIGVIVFLFATIFGFISLGIAWENVVKTGQYVRYYVVF